MINTSIIATVSFIVIPVHRYDIKYASLKSSIVASWHHPFPLFLHVCPCNIEFKRNKVNHFLNPSIKIYVMWSTSVDTYLKKRFYTILTFRRTNSITIVLNWTNSGSGTYAHKNLIVSDDGNNTENGTGSTPTIRVTCVPSFTFI